MSGEPRLYSVWHDRLVIRLHLFLTTSDFIIVTEVDRDLDN